MSSDGNGQVEHDEWKSVTTKISTQQLDDLEDMFEGAPSDPERIRRAVWMVTNASEITIDRESIENES
ncbi:hypothetical protein [Natronosalvus amylolyticus]|uniref:hypothetical protein n=1 Tax=Natronosalvus amylolyticus TaxID=2961994 RepID=UPI0020C94FF3|nr:hypothetical protein [Natronosalvus amylolyticus]